MATRRFILIEVVESVSNSGSMEYLGCMGGMLVLIGVAIAAFFVLFVLALAYTFLYSLVMQPSLFPINIQFWASVLLALQMVLILATKKEFIARLVSFLLLDGAALYWFFITNPTTLGEWFGILLITLAVSLACYVVCLVANMLTGTVALLFHRGDGSGTEILLIGSIVVAVGVLLLSIFNAISQEHYLGFIALLNQAMNATVDPFNSWLALDQQYWLTIPASVGVITGAALLEARLQTAFHF